MKVHVLACEIKNGYHRPNNKITRHLCGIKACTAADHLEFRTHIENGRDILIHQTNKNIKLTPNIVREIRRTMNTDSLTKIERAKKYNISVGNLRQEKNLELGKISRLY